MAASGIESGNGVPYVVGISSRDSLPWQASPSPASSRISPAVLFTVVILALIFFIAGLLHLLFRFLVKKRASFSAAASSSSSPHYNGRRRGSAGELLGGGVGVSGGLQRQLRQLFRLHDSGLDQAFIDALPLFLYREILGSKDPFDCAVCLCEFEPEDTLRLLPVCGHAFHLNCIDTWLLSNSTCPLCRGGIFAQGLTIENPIFDLDELREKHAFPGCWEAEGDEIVADKRVLSVRLGKFKNLSSDDSSGGDDGGGADIGSKRIKEVGETSSSSLDARRCFSMGYYQYVVADSDLQVALGGFARTINGDGESFDEGKRLGFGSRDESLSVSKIWQWSEKKGKFPVAASFDGSLLPWMRTSFEKETSP